MKIGKGEQHALDVYDKVVDVLQGESGKTIATVLLIVISEWLSYRGVKEDRAMEVSRAVLKTIISEMSDEDEDCASALD